MSRRNKDNRLPRLYKLAAPTMRLRIRVVFQPDARRLNLVVNVASTATVSALASAINEALQQQNQQSEVSVCVLGGQDENSPVVRAETSGSARQGAPNHPCIECHLSLNGRVPLAFAGPQTQLSDLGICSGDLVWLIQRADGHAPPTDQHVASNAATKTSSFAAAAAHVDTAENRSPRSRSPIRSATCHSMNSSRQNSSRQGGRGPVASSPAGAGQHAFRHPATPKSAHSSPSRHSQHRSNVASFRSERMNLHAQRLVQAYLQHLSQNHLAACNQGDPSVQLAGALLAVAVFSQAGLDLLQLGPSACRQASPGEGNSRKPEASAPSADTCAVSSTGMDTSNDATQPGDGFGAANSHSSAAMATSPGAAGGILHTITAMFAAPAISQDTRIRLHAFFGCRDVVWVHASCADRDHGFDAGRRRSFRFVTSDFVQEATTQGQGQGPTITAITRLSQKLRNHVILHLLSQLRSWAGQDDAESIVSLSTEMLLNIMRFMDAQTLLRLGQTCKTMYKLTHIPALWKALYIGTFERDSDTTTQASDDNVNWLNMFRQAWNRRQRDQRRLPLRHLPPVVDPFQFLGPDFDMRGFWPPALFPPDPMAGYMPGVLGGDYDLQAPPRAGDHMYSPIYMPDPTHGPMLPYQPGSSPHRPHGPANPARNAWNQILPLDPGAGSASDPHGMLGQARVVDRPAAPGTPQSERERRRQSAGPPNFLSAFGQPFY